MSVIGINIKKIRSVKGLNQTDFANLFGLTRANIGSYEELRAEPKIETIIKIATYYKLSIEKLVRKELTVNDISNFDVFSKLPVSTNSISKDEVMFITKKNLEKYPKNKTDKAYLAGLSKIVFPFGNEGSNKVALYNEGNELYFNNEGFLHGDILFLEKFLLKKACLGLLGVVVDEEAIYKGIIYFDSKKIIVKPLNPNLKESIVKVSKKIEIWKIVGRYSSEVINGLVEKSRVNFVKNIDNE
jgi:transcriptional regulator with XRE-family HTH domain